MVDGRKQKEVHAGDVFGWFAGLFLVKEPGRPP
jgi:hypothetical protein